MSLASSLSKQHFFIKKKGATITMKKHKVLQLGLQLGFPITMDTCNSWYLYNLECYRTSCNSYNGHPMLYTISYMRCNSHATIYNFFATNPHVIFPHASQHGKRNANVAFHPFVDKWHMLIPFTTYCKVVDFSNTKQLICNL
jgi:hypothetical protein